MQLLPLSSGSFLFDAGIQLIQSLKVSVSNLTLSAFFLVSLQYELVSSFWVLHPKIER